MTIMTVLEAIELLERIDTLDLQDEFKHVLRSRVVYGDNDEGSSRRVDNTPSRRNRSRTGLAKKIQDYLTKHGAQTVSGLARGINEDPKSLHAYLRHMTDRRLISSRLVSAEPTRQTGWRKELRVYDVMKEREV